MKRDLYDWWHGRIQNEATYGHRYFCIMALAIYAIKCNIPFSELEQDAFDLIPRMNDANPKEEFTHEDVLSALNAYDENYKNFPRADLEKLTAIAMPPNKRNGRTQDVHIKTLNAMRKFRRDDLGEDEYKNNGRPKGSGTKEKQVKKYIKDNPNATPTEVARALNISRPTVYKYMK